MVTAAPYAIRDMNLEHPFKIINHMEVGDVPAGMVLRRICNYLATGIPSSRLYQSEIIIKHTLVW